MLGLFGVRTFEKLAENLKAPEYEGFDENNVSRFHHNLRLLIERPGLPHDLLLAYDQNIVRHWRRIAERRNHGGPYLYPKYFQYLALLFTEIYLDRYFRTPTLSGSVERTGHGLQRRRQLIRPCRRCPRGARAGGQSRRAFHHPRPQQAGVLDGDRQRQDPLDAHQHPAVSALPGAPRRQSS
jgi:hypothetical protein